MLKFNFNSSKKKSNLNILDAFPIYRPYGTGSYNALSKMTIDGINSFPQALLSIINKRSFQIKKLSELINIKTDENTIEKFKEAFDLHGSDKATKHDYHILYSYITKNLGIDSNIFEIGLGTKNTNIVSHMRKSGKIGGSLRAFSELFPESHIYGADVDQEILFSEGRIKTFYVDQNRRESFSDLSRLIPDNMDLMIDDGLHAVHANLHSLEFFMSKIKVNGWIVVEDIAPHAVDVWFIVQHLLEQNYNSEIYESKSGSLIFAAQKMS